MYCDFEEYVKNRKPDKLSLKNLVNPSLADCQGSCQ